MFEDQLKDLPDNVLLEAVNLLHSNSIKMVSNEERIHHMKQVISGKINLNCTFNEWYNCITYINKYLSLSSVSLDDDIAYLNSSKKEMENNLNEKYS